MWGSWYSSWMPAAVCSMEGVQKTDVGVRDQVTTDTPGPKHCKESIAELAWITLSNTNWNTKILIQEDLVYTEMNQRHSNWQKQQLSVQVCLTMEPHFLSMERKLEPDGENRDLVFLLLTSLWPLAASCFSGVESQAEPSVLLIIKPKHAAASFPQHQGHIWEITIAHI